MTVEDTRQIVRAYHDAYCRGDVPAAAALLSIPPSFELVRSRLHTRAPRGAHGDAVSWTGVSAPWFGRVVA